MDVEEQRRPRAFTHSWDAYFERLPYRPTAFQTEADVYVERLLRVVAVGRRTHMLDFGCGAGLIAARLAPQVATVRLWDRSAAMRRRAAANVTGLPNASVATAPPVGECFELIVVNSVLQYLTSDERRGCLACWRAALAPAGCVVVSDVLVDEEGSLRRLVEVAEVLMLHARRHQLARFVRERLGDVVPYWRSAHRSPLVRVHRDQLAAEARAAGFDVDILPASLTCRRRRLSAILRAATAATGGCGPSGGASSAARTARGLPSPRSAYR